MQPASQLLRRGMEPLQHPSSPISIRSSSEGPPPTNPKKMITTSIANRCLVDTRLAAALQSQFLRLCDIHLADLKTIEPCIAIPLFGNSCSDGTAVLIDLRDHLSDWTCLGSTAARMKCC